MVLGVLDQRTLGYSQALVPLLDGKLCRADIYGWRYVNEVS